MLKINKDIQIGDTGRTLEMLGETVAETLPVGTIAPYGGAVNQVPQNWLPCDGREVSRLEYAKLFSIIGTRFGAGDSSTTFNLPNLQGKVPVGQDVNDTAFDVLGETGGEKTHTLTVSEMPAHDHNIEGYKGVGQWADGELWFRAAGQGSDNTFVSANRSANTGGGQAHNNLQPYQVTLYIIKAFDQQLGNLRSESLPVGSEIDFDGTVSEIPEGWEATGETDDYSTNETLTGKHWIDGKPIYRKVYTGQIADGTIAHGLSNVTFVNSYGHFVSGSGAFMPLPCLRVAYPEYSCGYYVNATSINFERGNSANGTAYIVLEYTKTTD